MNKYTVIIPTRDRVETLEATIRTCLRQTYENFEILVSDNCSVDNTKEVVERFHDPRLHYISPGQRLSMSGHFEFALAHVTDGFVMFIGSDDGIMPDAIHYVDAIVRQYDVDAVSCRQATYVWPNFPDREIAGRLTFGNLREDIEIRDASEWIKRTLNFQTSYCFDLPNLYCGFVHKRVIDKAYKDGKYFRSITPDAYSAFATAIFINRYAFSHKPFSIAGASVKSNGASSMHPETDSKEISKFRSENDINFFDGFVNCPSYEIILAEAFAQLSRVFPNQCSEYRIDYASMLRKALDNANAKTAKEIGDAVKIMSVNFSEAVHVSSASSNPVYKSKVNLGQRLLQLNPLSRIIEIKKSAAIGVTNVDDAALVAHVLMQNRNENLFMTRRDILIKRLKMLIGF